MRVVESLPVIKAAASHHDIVVAMQHEALRNGDARKAVVCPTLRGPVCVPRKVVNLLNMLAPMVFAGCNVI